MNKTILYYTSNREKPRFEARIIKTLLKNSGGLPIISVSQKPMKLGKNICVGDVGFSYLNEWRQIIIGAKEAKTEYLVFAESDFLYPSEYFEFEPKGHNLYRCNNVWVVFRRGHNAHRKKHSEGAQIVKRKVIINHLTRHLKNYPDWYDGPRKAYMTNKKLWKMSRSLAYEKIENKIPCVSFKTGHGVRRGAGTYRGKANIAEKLPYWGDVARLVQRYTR